MTQTGCRWCKEPMVLYASVLVCEHCDRVCPTKRCSACIMGRRVMVEEDK